MPELAAGPLAPKAWSPPAGFPVHCASLALDTMPLGGLIHLQGDAAAPALAAAVLQATGLQLPGAGRHASRDAFTLAWAAPDEWLLFCALEQEAELLDAFTKAFAGHFLSATPLSDARIGFEVSGAAADDFIAQGCAIDTRDAGFGAGALAITRFAGLTAVLMRMPHAYRLHFDASYQAFIVDWMLDASAQWRAS